MTGIASNVVEHLDLEMAAYEVKKENEKVAKLIGINPAQRTTCVKPAGTTSLVLGTSSGIHAWHNDYYIRRLRVGKDEAIIRHESVFDLLERVKNFSIRWVRAGHNDGLNTHNVSATISIKEDEWERVAEWMWLNRHYYNGLSVLPYDGGTYTQAPFEDCDAKKYHELSQTLTEVDLTKVIESQDNTDLSGEIACAGGACEI